MITDDHLEELDKLLAAAVQNHHLFTEWEYDFISDWADKLDFQRNKVLVSDKQQYIFDRLQRKLEGAGEL